MNRRLTVVFDDAWVLEHREDLTLPIDFIINIVKKEYSEFLETESSSFTEIVFSVKNGADTDKITKALTDAVKARYGLVTIEGIMSFDITEVKRQPTHKKAVPSKFPELTLPDFLSKKTSETPKTDTQNCLDGINGLVGAEEFKALAEELCQIAPIIAENKIPDTLNYQSYIFSINDGYGLTTYLEMLNKLISSFDIITMASEICELKLDPPKDGTMEPFSRTLGELDNINRNKVKLVCIDISEWLNNTGGHLFKTFLSMLQKYMDKYIVVFRIPFVDKEIIESVRRSLNDLVFVRSVSFAPFTKDEIKQYAASELEKYGFTVSPSAWECFNERINEEKSDGKFYGLNTVKKVVRELLYKKQLANARAGKNDLTITKKDTAALCSEVENIGLGGYEMLEQMVGADTFKQRINEIISQIEIARANPDMQSPCIHMRFVGNPGTGKTTVARIIGKILREKGVLRIGNFYEYAGRDLCGRYIGETAPKTASICRDAYGSVLFIDEAYSLYKNNDNPRDYGTEALDTLIAEMENHRSDFVVIMAGYTDEMDMLMQGNVGLASRMPYVLEFPNFTKEQLYDIFVSMVKKQFKYEDELFVAAKNYFDSLSDEFISSKEFSNGRFVRNLFERVWAKAAMRSQLAKKASITLTKDDFDRSVSEKEFSAMMEKKKNTRIGF